MIVLLLIVFLLPGIIKIKQKQLFIMVQNNNPAPNGSNIISKLPIGSNMSST